MSARDRYLEEMQAQLDEWNREIDSLEARIEKSGVTAASELQARILEARQVHRTAGLKVAQIRYSKARWESVKDELSPFWKVLKRSVNDFGSQF